jgi:hypothetical protein
MTDVLASQLPPLWRALTKSTCDCGAGFRAREGLYVILLGHVEKMMCVSQSVRWPWLGMIEQGLNYISTWRVDRSICCPMSVRDRNPIINIPCHVRRSTWLIATVPARSACIISGSAGVETVWTIDVMAYG